MSGMGKPGDEQTWVYDADTDRWFAGAASGGSGGGATIVTASGGFVRYHDTTYNPVGLWQLSGSLVDLGSQVTHLTIGAGTQRYTNMAPGLRGFMFDGSTQLVNTASLPASMCLTGAMTVEMLAIVEPSTAQQTLFEIGGLTGDINGSENYLVQIAVIAPGNLNYFSEQNNGTNISYDATGSCVPFNELCHIAMTRDSSAQVRFYVNGVLMDTSVGLAQPNTGSTAPSSARVMIGSETPGSFSTIGTTPLTKTSVASVKLVNRQLTDAEIVAEYQRTIGNLYINTSVVSQSITNNNIFLSGAIAQGNSAANYFFVTASNEWLVQGGSVFVGMPGMTGSITTTGGPVLISVNANYVAQSGSPTALFSLAKNGVNLGHPLWGMQAAGPKVNSYNDNVSLWYMDFPPAGTHTYSFIGCNPTGSGYIGNYGVSPGAIMAFELPKTANVVTASSMLQHTVAGTDIVGLSASITPTRGPVLALCSLNYANTNAGNWAWSNIHRDGTGLGSTFGIALTVGTNANQFQNMSEMVLDTGMSLGASHTYTVRTTNGAGTGVTSRNNMFATLILFELSDANWKYVTSAATVNLAGSYTDFIGTVPTPALQTRGRPVMLLAAMQSNTTNTTGRAAFSFLRNGSSIVTASKGMQLMDGENTSDWNRVPTMMWFDQVNAGLYNYQVAGFNVSGTNNMQQGPTLGTFLMYELDPTGGSVFGGWLDTGNRLSTTAAISISDGTERLTDPSLKGQDVYFYVSGTVGQTTASNPQNARVALFGGDVRISGSVTVGSGSVKMTSNDVQFGGFESRIERQGSDLKFFDVNNPSGKTLSNFGQGGGGGGGTLNVTASFTASSDWVTVFDVDFTTQPTASFTANSLSNALAGFNWITENMANADSIGVVPGVGLLFDPNANNSDQFTSVYTAPSLILPLSRAIADFRQEDYELRLWGIFEVTGSDANFEVTRVGFARYPFFDGNTRFYNSIAKGFSSGLIVDHNNFYNGTHTAGGNVISNAVNAFCVHQKAFTESDVYFAIVSPGATFPQNPTSAQGYKLNSFQRFSGNAFGSTVTGSADISVHIEAFTVNTNNSFQATYRRLKLEARRKFFNFTGSLAGTTNATSSSLAEFVPAPNARTMIHWKFNSGSLVGNNIYVNSGVSASLGLGNTALTATIPNNIRTNQSGVFQESVGFSHVSLIAPDISASIAGDKLTIATWIKPIISGSGWKQIVAKAYTSGSWLSPFIGGGALYLPNAGNDLVEYTITTTGGNRTAINSDSNTALKLRGEQWNHVVLVYDGAFMRGYINGIQVAVSSKTGNLDWGTASGGWSVGGNHIVNDEYFSGSIDDIRIEQNAWTPEQVREHYDTGMFRTYVTGSKSLIAAVAGIGGVSTGGSSGGGAGEVSASYVVMGLTSSLANERQLVAGYGLTLQDGGPNGQAIISFSGSLSGSVIVNTTLTYPYAGFITGSFQVPAGVTQLNVKMWGPGGGSGVYSAPNLGAGAGGYTEGVVNVTPGETLLYIIGGGGLGTSGAAGIGGNGGWGNGGFGTQGDASGGGGGGFTGLFTASVHQQTAIMIAGGGGAGTGFRAGGGGGGLTGSSAPVANGTGGTQAAAGGPSAGGALYGGKGTGQQAVSTGDDDGGGGSGYFGGGGGSGDGAGGGGGAGYIRTGSWTGGAQRVVNGITHTGQVGQGSGARSIPPFSTDLDYLTIAPTNTGKGGAANTAGSGIADGGHGYMIIRYSVGQGEARWVEESANNAIITSSVAIGTGTRASLASGVDTFFYVSGTFGLTGSVAKKAVFGGDLVVSGTISTGLAPIVSPLSSASWQVVNLANSTITDENGTIFISKPDQSGPQVTALVRGVPGTPWKATAMLGFNPPVGESAGLQAMYLRQSSDGKLIGFGFHWETGGLWRWVIHKLNSPTGAGAGDYLAQNYNMFAPIMWLQIEDNGTNRIHRVSWDGKFFRDIFSVSRTDFMTADQVGFGVDTQGAPSNIRLYSWKLET